jgi:hypothetical protein
MEIFLRTTVFQFAEERSRGLMTSIYTMRRMPLLSRMSLLRYEPSFSFVTLSQNHAMLP